MNESQEGWLWMGHTAHFICGKNCQFHLATVVGSGNRRFIVSTVGEYWPDSQVRKIHAESAGVVIEGRGDAWDAAYFKRFGYEEIGCGRTYETYVFRASADVQPCGCIGPRDWSEIDSLPANDAKTATENHYALCEKWNGAHGKGWKP